MPDGDLRSLTTVDRPPVLRSVPNDPEPARPTTARRRSDVDAWGRSARARAVANVVFAPVHDRWFRAEWEGLEHIPATGGALLVANHAGAIPPDAPVLMHGIETRLGRPVYGLGDHLFRDLPTLGTLWSRFGGVVAHPENAQRLLADDGALALVFPEGSKGTSKLVRDRYRLARFGRGGFVDIALRAGVPIIPIAVVGAEEAMPVVANNNSLARRLGMPYLPLTANMLLLGPIGTVTWFPAKFRIRVLEPVHLDAVPGQDHYRRSQVMETAEDVRGRIQTALHDLLRERRSIWR
jgi:1-acyl-sn-glycerol-3-phosphate acyltransferase